MDLEALNFVPTVPLIGHVLLVSVVIGLPVSVKVLTTRGGPLLTRLAAMMGITMAGVMALLTLRKGNTLFVWHVIGMSVGVFALQPTAVHAILAKHAFLKAEARKMKIMEHKVLQMASAACMFAGFAAIFAHKPAGFPGKHFMTVHSLVGLVALGLMAFNLLHAAFQQGNPLRPKLMWISTLHRTVGTLAFVFSIFAAMLGLFNKSVIVDWAASPITLKYPSSWHTMAGWTKNTHGEATAWAFISGSGLLLAKVLLAAPKRPLKKDT